MSVKNGKVWGENQPIFLKNNVEINRIIAKAGYRCSIHLHDHKHNMFYVESGSVHVDVQKNDYDLTDTTVLRAGDSTCVGYGEYHHFLALEDSIVYEIYWVELSADDITRKDCGREVEPKTIGKPPSDQILLMEIYDAVQKDREKV